LVKNFALVLKMRRKPKLWPWSLRQKRRPMLWGWHLG